MTTAETTTAAPGGGRARRAPRSGTSTWVVLVILLGPAVLILGALVAYPIVFSLVRGLFDQSGETFVGLGNYVDMFTDAQTFRALRNNAIWVLVAPAVCTVLGLIFAVLMERIRWQTAFKLIIFMPMAISMLAAGVIFRSVFQQNPDIGLANAVIVSVQEMVGAESTSYPDARPRPEGAVELQETGEMTSTEEVAAGSVVEIPLVGIAEESRPADAVDAVEPPAAGDDQVTGAVWFDFIVGGGGTNGEVGDGKPGLGGIDVVLTDASGAEVATAVTQDDGTFVVEGLDPGGEYTLTLPASSFAPGASGIDWLGPGLITPVTILAYVWIWAGFAMVMIASGLSSVDRSLLEAARTDGANEWQVFRRITVPQLAPVLMVVMVTLVINVLKIFDLVYVIPPGVSKPAADVIATRMWTVSFGGGNDQGLGSALAIFLLLLVLPAILLNIRNFRRGGQA
ncbi:ABC transporter permease subunit [Georgenia sp. Z1344]|uniref:ABC transporter permease subunit n=1 Tax=Georgenia sp. Z1344 TaxID=3416706 RepID=UPI003CF1DF5A